MEIKINDDLSRAVAALGALAQEHRLTVFRLLIEAGKGGLAAGAIADQLGVARSSLSFHLTNLKNAGLIEERRNGRSIIYTANYAAMRTLITYLMTNCCAGDAVDAHLIEQFSIGELK